MSYVDWTVDGYGIPLGEFNPNLKKLVDILELAPKAKVEVLPIINNHVKEAGFDSVEDADKEELLDRFDGEIFNQAVTDVAYVLSEVLTEVMGITISAIAGYDDEYLLYVPRCPWELSDKEKMLTHKGFCDNFVKVLTMADGTVSEEEIRGLIEEQSVKNGG